MLAAVLGNAESVYRRGPYRGRRTLQVTVISPDAGLFLQF